MPAVRRCDSSPALCVPPAAEALSRTLGALRLSPRPSGDPPGAARTGQQARASGPAPGPHPVQAEPGATLEYVKVSSEVQQEVSRAQQPLPVPSCPVSSRPFQAAALLPPDRARTLLLLMSMPERSFSLADAMEAVQLSADFPSALRFLSHSCPICQEQVSFSQVRPRPPPPPPASAPLLSLRLLCSSCRSSP